MGVMGNFRNGKKWPCEKKKKKLFYKLSDKSFQILK